MDRYDRVILDVLQQTEEGLIEWKVIPWSQVQSLRNPDLIHRSFRAPYILGVQTFTLLFLEKKVEIPDEWDSFYQKIVFELIVLAQDDEIVLRLFDGVVEGDDLLKLARLIESRNDRVAGFFAAFETAKPAVDQSR